MANLKGSSYERQIVDAQCRMSAIGQNKSGGDSDSHSLATQDKRLNMLNDFANFAKNDLNSSEKLNSLMTSENVNQFLNSRIENLAASSKEEYTRAFSAMTKSLNDNNISTSVDKEVFNHIVNEAKLNDTSIIRTDRAVSDLNSLYQRLGDRHESSAITAELMAEQGFRISEAVEVVNNLESHLNRSNGEISGVFGKTGKEYQIKTLSPQIIAKIDNLEKTYSKSTFEKDLQSISFQSHDLRYTWAKNEFERISEEKNNSSEKEISLNAHRETLKAVSEGLNHRREDITTQYLSKA
jgi:hypothetical protein